MDNLDTEDTINLNKNSDIKSTLDEISDKNYNQIKEAASTINVNELTPIEAITQLNSLIERISEL